MDIKEAMKQIETGLEIVKANPDKIRKLIPMLFNLLDVVSIVDKEMCSELKAKFVKIANSPDVRTITVKIEEIAESIKSLKEKVKTYGTNPYGETYLGKYYGMISVNDSDKEYRRAIQKYADKSQAIKKLEGKIVSSNAYVKNLHELISNHKTYGGYFHARLTGNLRLMYIIENEILTFKDIITKNEFDNRR